MESFIKMTQDNLVISQNVIIHPGFSSAMLSIKKINSRSVYEKKFQ